MGDAPQAVAFRACYEANIGPIYRFLYSKVGNREEAEDLTAQVFTKALHGIDWTRAEADARHWLFHVARTVLADHWRRVYRLPTTSLDDLLAAGWEVAEPGDNAAPDADHPRALVADLLAHLPPNYREVLRCRFLLNLSIKETATHLNLSEANVKVLQFRAVKRAAELYAPQHEEVATDEQV